MSYSYASSLHSTILFPLILVNRRCQIRSRSGVSYQVRSGQTIVNPESCQRCLCDDGELELCERVGDNCDRFDPQPRDATCEARGETVQNGGSVQVSIPQLFSFWHSISNSNTVHRFVAIDATAGMADFLVLVVTVMMMMRRRKI